METEDIVFIYTLSHPITNEVKYTGEKNPMFGVKYWGKNKHLNHISK